MYISGYVIENNDVCPETYIIDTALFDTGASSANYISEDYVNKYITIFKPHILAHNSSVRLGDSKTQVNITHIITLNISFLDNNSITHEGLLNFSIMHMKLDMIIGIESILFTFYDLFLDMLKTAKAHQSKQFNFKLIDNHKTLNPYKFIGPDPSQVGIKTNANNVFSFPPSISSTDISASPQQAGATQVPAELAHTPVSGQQAPAGSIPPSTGGVSSLSHEPIEYPSYPSTSNHIPRNNPDYENCVPTFTTTEATVAPEELLFPDPCSFTGPLMFLGVDRDKVLSDYYGHLEKNINPDFIKACPGVIPFMKSDIALKVFCPEGWHGISGIPELKLETSPLLPTRTYNRARTVRDTLLENAKSEFLRLCKYMYVPSTSPIASPLVIAPKPTPPYVRFCGDYVFLNKFIIFMQMYIPIVMHELEKAAEGRVYLDMDMKNAFHQVVLDKATSNLLSIVTPWGTVRPLFMPEGISPASGILHNIMTDILSEWLDCAIVIFDNFLVVCTDFEDAYTKLVGFITTCSERNVILGMAKTKLGWLEAIFFGYLIKDGTYQLTPERKLAVSSLAMPQNKKQAQSVCGSSIFFAKNIINYANICAPMNDMCAKDFSFDPKTWSRDYNKDFDRLKEAILGSIAITFPDFSLPFILRTDASDVAWGAVLIQVREGGEYQCIALESGKWSDAAKDWDIEKKEAGGIVMAFRKMHYLVTGKYVIIETDNKNMLFMETATSAIIKRWRVFIQGFHTSLRHILAKFNTVSDWLTRQYHLYLTYTHPDNTNTNYNSFTSDLYLIHDEQATDTDAFFTAVLNVLVPKPDTSVPDALYELEPVTTPITLTLTDMFTSVHGGRKFHKGIRQTWLDLNERYPGHSIPIRVVADLITTCPTCQKVRKAMEYSLPSKTLTLKPPYYRKRVGIDTLTITPVDKFGNSLVIVIVEHFSKFCSIFPCSDHTADNTARALWQHYVTYGKFEQVISDPGSDLMSKTIILLNEWLGQEKLVSLVQRHESNGVEPTNKKILLHVRTLAQDLRIAHHWSDPTIIQLIAYAINSAVHSETNYSAMELKFGSADLPWMSTVFDLPDNNIISSKSPLILQQLNDNIKTIRDLSHTYQQQLVADRDNSALSINKYQPGDLVLFIFSVTGEALTKISSQFLGPYSVISHVQNDVTVRNLVTEAISVFHSSRLKPFLGTLEQAKEAALRDTEQYEIAEFIAYRGDPLIRTSMIFYIRFSDGCHHWKEWSNDLFSTQQYETFCASIPQLFPLIYLSKVASTLIKEINSQPILTVSPGTTVYMDLRAIGAGWYESLNLPNSDFSVYVVPLSYTGWQNKQHTKIQATIPSLDCQWTGRSALNTFFVKSYGNSIDLQPNMTLCTYDFISQHDLINKYKNDQ
jgi:hypothetical protein